MTTSFSTFLVSLSYTIFVPLAENENHDFVPPPKAVKLTLLRRIIGQRQINDHWFRIILLFKRYCSAFGLVWVRTIYSCLILQIHNSLQQTLKN